MRSKKVINILNLIGLVFMLYESYIFSKNGNPFNTENLHPIFLPASYAFSIWFFIYIALIIWVIKGFLASPKDSILYKKVSLWFIVSMILTGLSLKVPLRTSPIFTISSLISFLIIYNVIDNVIAENSISSFYKIPFSMINGWLSVAIISNISLVLKSFNIISIMGINEVGWTVIMLITGTIIAILFTLTKLDIIFPLMFIWGYIGIIFRNPYIPKVLKVSLTMCIILVLIIAYTIYIKRVTNKEKYLLHINIKKT